MVVFPNCKINLGLNIIHKREDGFHDLETIFYPVNICDAVEVIKMPQASPTSASHINFKTTGLNLPQSAGDNLCIKAYHLLKNDFNDLPPVDMFLYKNIPAGAGLGGGSADAAFTLKLLNERFQLNLSTAQLIKYAVKLGSDCAFFILNTPCFASGRGEILSSFKINLAGYFFAVIVPPIHIDTERAFSQIVPHTPKRSVKQIAQEPVKHWKNFLVNDFEKLINIQYPQIGIIKKMLYNAGAVYASMSGSGSSVFGLFETDKIYLNQPADHSVFICKAAF